MFGDVLHRFQTAEVHGRLDLRVEPIEFLRLDFDG